MDRPRARGTIARWKSTLPAVLTAVVCGLLVATVPGQPEPPPADPPALKADDPPITPADEGEEKEAEEEEEKEPVHIEHADLMNYDPEKELYFLTGNVHFRHKDTHLYCDEAQYNEAEDTARATGNLKIVQPETTITGDLITADFDEELADIIGNVRLVTQKKKKEQNEEAKPEGEAGANDEADEEPKPAEGEEQPAEEDEEEPGKWDEHKEKLTIVTCEKIRYWYEEERALATGNVVAEQEDKTCYADEADYVEEEDLLTLKGNPVRVVMENGNRFHTPWIKVEVEGERFWTGGFQGTFKKEKKEKEGEEEPEEQPAEEREEPGTPGGSAQPEKLQSETAPKQPAAPE